MSDVRQSPVQAVVKKYFLIVVAILAGVQLWSRDPQVHADAADLSFGYVVRYTGGAGSGARLPLLVALHGDGDTAGHFYDTALDQLDTPARVVLLKGPIDYGTGDAWPGRQEEFVAWGDALAEVVQELLRKYPTHGQPVLFGFSGGAMMAYYQAARHGDLYGGVVPVSGRLTREMIGGDPVPSAVVVRAFHGRGDSVVQVGGGRHAARLLRDAGIDIELTEFDGGHLGLFRESKPLVTAALAEALESVSSQTP